MKKAALFIALCLLSVCAFAGEVPSKVVKGKVYDKNSHEVLAGVKVSIENSNQSVYTDFEGNFTLLITGKEKAVLTFSTISYGDAKVSVTDSFSEVQVQLAEL